MQGDQGGQKPRCAHSDVNKQGNPRAVWPIFLATKAPISLSKVAQRAQLKFFNIAQRA